MVVQASHCNAQTQRVKPGYIWSDQPKNEELVLPYTSAKMTNWQATTDTDINE